MTPTPPPEDDLPDDPDLVAYLDGELDADDSRSVESKIALDAAVRTKAAEYKKTFDLLDFLPKPEPSPTFTTRTLTRLQPVPANASGSTPGLSVSRLAMPAPRRRLWPELCLWLLALVAAGAGGFFGHSFARPYLNPSEAEKFDRADLSLIHDLPLYAGVDDFEFLKKIREAELFDDEIPAAPRAAANDDDDKISLVSQEKLIAQFLAYPPVRQRQLRELHKRLYELPANERAGYHRTLEAYAVWLDRLPDADRKEILNAADGADRLDAVLRIRERIWRVSLPPSQQKALKTVATVEERTQFLKELREREQTFRREWTFAHSQWQPNKSEDQKPWPFSDPALAKAVDDYIRKAFGVDPAVVVDRKGEVAAPCRLTKEELVELKYRHDAALKEGYWFSYGACLLQLAEQHPTLPEPGKGKPMTMMDQSPLTPMLVRKLAKIDGGNIQPRFRSTLGRWPDFALEIHKLDPNNKEKLPPLGPCKPGDFTDELDVFLKDQLLPKLTKGERDKLDAQLGKWPEYPRMMLDLARAKNLGVPGATLPGEPKRWNDQFRIPVGKK